MLVPFQIKPVVVGEVAGEVDVDLIIVKLLSEISGHIYPSDL